jgi:hypothetical protein
MKRRKKKGLSARAALIKRASKLRSGSETTKSLFRMTDEGLKKYIRVRRTSFDQ